MKPSETKVCLIAGGKHLTDVMLERLFKPILNSLVDEKGPSFTVTVERHYDEHMANVVVTINDKTTAESRN